MLCLTFDKMKFAEILEKAKGSRSINQYWLHSEVSATYISKLLRCLVENPPGPEILRKLAEHAENGIMYEDFMQAAGHLESCSLNDFREKHLDLWPEIKRSVLSSLTVDQRRHLIKVIQNAKNIPFEEAMDLVDDFINNFDNLPLETQVAAIAAVAPSVDVIKDTSKNMLPVIGTVCAGNGGYACEEILGQEYVDLDLTNDGNNYFWLLVKGDSMVGEGILENDLALIRHKPDVENGSLAVVLVDQEEGRIKRVIKKDNTIVLQSANPVYPASIFVGEDINRIKIVGEVIEIKRHLKNSRRWEAI